ncbi:MAG TPA: FAD binding domain-containing protein [Bryobacteraceae bacterium]|nr:FAD binding domain-containing protein [Bryobacteraceae bacterium]
MFDKVEAFYRPASVREALRLLHSGNGRARVVAGGTDVAVEADESIRFLIDITGAGLDYIQLQANVCTLGATVTMAALEASPIIHGLAGGILARAASTSGSVQIRNVGTVGGNLANGCAAADLATTLLALDAEVVLARRRGRKKRALAALYSQERTALLDGALLLEVAIPVPPAGGNWSFQKLGRTELDLSLVNVACGLALNADGRVEWLRVAMGAVGPCPLRATVAEELAAGRVFDDALVAEICDEVARTAKPITDVRASAEYRRAMCRVLAKRALQECAVLERCSL